SALPTLPASPILFSRTGTPAPPRTYARRLHPNPSSLPLQSPTAALSAAHEPAPHAAAHAVAAGWQDRAAKPLASRTPPAHLSICADRKESGPAAPASPGWDSDTPLPRTTSIPAKP